MHDRINFEKKVQSRKRKSNLVEFIKNRDLNRLNFKNYKFLNMNKKGIFGVPCQFIEFYRFCKKFRESNRMHTRMIWKCRK